jgi:hypothetical protein
VADLIDDAEARGLLSPAERRDILLADLVVRGRRREDQEELYLVVEISVGIGPGDVERAERRASLLGRIQAAIPVVAGEGITPEAMALAETRGVWRVLDGQILAPGPAKTFLESLPYLARILRIDLKATIRTHDRVNS